MKKVKNNSGSIIPETITLLVVPAVILGAIHHYTLAPISFVQAVVEGSFSTLLGWGITTVSYIGLATLFKNQDNKLVVDLYKKDKTLLSNKLSTFLEILKAHNLKPDDLDKVSVICEKFKNNELIKKYDFETVTDFLSTEIDRENESVIETKQALLLEFSKIPLPEYEHPHHELILATSILASFGIAFFTVNNHYKNKHKNNLKSFDQEKISLADCNFDNSFDNSNASFYRVDWAEKKRPGGRQVLLNIGERDESTPTRI